MSEADPIPPPDPRPESSAGPASGASPEAALREEIAALLERIANLETALVTNRRIAMALGILMARHSLSEEQAFAELRSASQRRHQKLREIADEVVYTGDIVRQVARTKARRPDEPPA